MGTFRLLDTGYLSAAANMALDKIILEEVDSGASPPTLRFLQFRPAAALVGYHQDVSLEIRTDYCAAHGIDVNRRLTGGGSILFQESGLGWELFGRRDYAPFRGPYDSVLTRICSAAAAGLARLGIPAVFRPRNDIEVQGKKVSGTGGVALSQGIMFQGTVLMQNQVELFLKALRIPVEKLKKREIESLMQRICFLEDIAAPAPSVERVKQALCEEFSIRFGITLISGDLTRVERQRLAQELPYFESREWIMHCSRPPQEGQPLRSITQTDAGTMRVHLWMAPGGKRIRQALICGDFFTIPARLVHDLEAALVGVRATREAVREAVLSFFSSYDGRILGISGPKVAKAVASAAERLLLMDKSFSPLEVNELFLLNLGPEDLARYRPRWLLLPYCSKNLDCPFRGIPGCDECGQCEIGDCFEMARSFNMMPVTVQSFEHLMTVLRECCARRDGMYVGSCCEAFYSKHQAEMAQVEARGVLVNLDSTTCYDLGKGSAAYQGRFDTKTSLNLKLIAKTLRRLHAYHSPM
jgi:lipoate---protein ligase